MQKRKDGQYWVLFDGLWEVAFYIEGIWNMSGTEEEFLDKEFEEIDEKMLIHDKQ